MKYNSMGFDLGTELGWAVGSDGNYLYGSKKFTKKDKGEKYSDILEFFTGILNEYNVRKVYYEKVMGHIGTYACHTYGAIEALLQIACYSLDIPYQGIHVGTIKKEATGSGRASKSDMVESAKKLGVDTDNDNIADAVWTLHVGLKGDNDGI